MPYLPKNKKPAIFLDRDGVINKEINYLHKISDFKFLPDVITALKRIPKNYKIIIITNQAGIAKGHYKKSNYFKLNKWMLEQFENENIKIHKVYYCPHHPDDKCSCRKPKPGMLKKAQKQFNIDLKKSWLIGDKTSDILAGSKVGCKTILVNTGYGGKDKLYKIKPDYKTKNLLKAIELIIKNENFSNR